jgi:trehalose/maltose transport system substrate-binding protein
MKKTAMFIALTAAISASAASAAGVTVSFACDSTGNGFNECKKGTDAWAKKTGNSVKLLQVPVDTGDRLALYQQQLGAKSADVDVYMIDVVWPGIIGNSLLDLGKSVPAAQLASYFPAIVENNTYNGKLVGVPWFTDGGLLFYRTDLMEKYGYKAAPKTWTELQTMATKIQAGERAANAKFTGFVFQGKNYEGLTCNALEWIASYGGGSVVDPTGKVTINNPQAVAAIKQIGSFVGTISPEAVTTYAEEDARNVFQSGSAAFMRNWPYAYSLGQSANSPVKGKIGVAALPSGEGGKSTATLGGWQLAVNAYSKHPKEAADLVAYLTSSAEQKRRAISGSYSPTIPALYKDADVLKAAPFFGSLFNALTNASARPATATKGKYNQVSNAFASAVYNVLTKKQTAEAALAGAQTQITRVKGRTF